MTNASFQYMVGQVYARDSGGAKPLVSGKSCWIIVLTRGGPVADVF